MSATRPWGIGVSPDGRKIYTANGPSGDVSIVDVASGTVEKQVKVGGSPWGMRRARGPGPELIGESGVMMTAAALLWSIWPCPASRRVASASVSAAPSPTVTGRCATVRAASSRAPSSCCGRRRRRAAVGDGCGRRVLVCAAASGEAVLIVRAGGFAEARQTMAAGAARGRSTSCSRRPACRRR